MIEFEFIDDVLYALELNHKYSDADEICEAIFCIMYPVAGHGEHKRVMIYNKVKNEIINIFNSYGTLQWIDNKVIVICSFKEVQEKMINDLTTYILLYKLTGGK